ncbi:MAG: aa3-type cytochrome c oxidase subunit IV [Hyphomicrobiales bacterium]|nr:aa3-type cytochrome c oxidase subunit IV [Hyphomicrobiales bacterium]
MAKNLKNAVIPPMDYLEHERTYQNFVKLFKWGTISLVVLVILLAQVLL